MCHDMWKLQGEDDDEFLFIFNEFSHVEVGTLFTENNNIIIIIINHQLEDSSSFTYIFFLVPNEHNIGSIQQPELQLFEHLQYKI